MSKIPEDDDEMKEEYDFSNGVRNPYYKSKDYITSWDFRIFKGDDGLFTIGEVYYSEEGKPKGWISDGLAPSGESVEELSRCLKNMMDALKKPVFIPPKEIKEKKK